MNDAVIGHNKSPDMAEIANQTMADISGWMGEHPVVQSMEEAQEGKTFFDRGKLALQDLDDERDKKVRPLNEKVKEINDYYRPTTTVLKKVLDALSDRLTDFIREETRKKEEAAREADRLAREAESRAREAERLEQEVLEAADCGELGLDTAGSIKKADEAFREFERAKRAGALAESETNVTIHGGHRRAFSGPRKKETLIVVDAFAALREMGVTDDVKEAIVKSARAWRKITGDLPDGVESQTPEEI